VILQVTKRCDFNCVFCSETLQMGDPTLDRSTSSGTTWRACSGCSWHQLCSDLAVLAAAGSGEWPVIRAAATAWRQRRGARSELICASATAGGMGGHIGVWV